jgi:hypothetical protein
MASLFGDYQPGAISSFLASHKASGAASEGGSGSKKAKQPSKEKQQQAATAKAPTPPPAAAASAVLFDEATRAKFQPQQPLPGLVALPKRQRLGEDGA